MKTLTRGQTAVLTAATVPMIVAGTLGAWGTYANITSVFHRSATALGVVAAGEGATLVLALVLVGLTMLGQPSPLPVRAGLWLLPLTAAVTGAVVAPGTRDAVVFAITPMAMTVSAEGLGLLARRIVVHTTGVDVEAQRRNAAILRRIAYHRARAARHPKDGVRKRSERIAWRLARRVGEGDAQLGVGLITVQRGRITDSADAALGAMLVGLPTQPQPGASEAGDFEATVDTALTVTAAAQPDQIAAATDPQPDADADAGDEDAQPQPSAQPDALILDLAPMLPVQPHLCAPAPASVQPQPNAHPQPRSRAVAQMRTRDDDAPLLERARDLNVKSLRETGKKAPLRLLQGQLGIGQRRAQRIQEQLPDTLAAATAEAQPHAKEA